MSWETCTWVGCGELGMHEQLDKLGNRWAYLCPQHHEELDNAIRSLVPRLVMKAWIRAHGGAQRLTEKMRPALQAGVDALMKGLKKR